MTWKPKEKELSQDEAIELAKKELAPFWFSSTPQFAGVKTEEGFQVFPLDPEFLKKAWLLFFVDPTDFCGEASFVYAKEWHKRYNAHQLGIVLIMTPAYQYLQTPAAVAAIVEKNQLTFPVVLDSEQAIAGAFKAQSLPKILLLSHGRTFFEYSGKNWLGQTEIEVQNFLRSTDPGLPLLPVFQPLKAPVGDLKRIEFGFLSKQGEGIINPAPGFEKSDTGVRRGDFHGLRPKSLGADEIFVSGSWMQDSEKIATSDPNAMIIFRTSASRVSGVAQSLAKPSEIPMISIEIQGAPAYDAIAGEHMLMDDSGKSVAEVSTTRLYHFLANLPNQDREITLRFPNADVASVALYGLRLGK